MDPRLPSVPIILLGLLLAALYDPILGLIVLLLGLMTFLISVDPSHAHVAAYFLLPMIIFLFFVRIFRDALPEAYRIYAIFLFVILSLAIAAIAGHDYNGLLFTPMFIIPIAIALAYDPSGHLAVIAAVATYVPYAILIFHLVRSVKTSKHPLIGKQGVVVERVTREGGLIKIGNTYWDAITHSRIPIEPGERVIVVDVDGIKLIVDRPSSALRRQGYRLQ